MDLDHPYIARSRGYLPSSDKTKVSDLVADYLACLGVRAVFVLTGGCAVHLIQSFSEIEKVEVLPVQHEQSGAMAADAYSRVSGELGVAIATSGPGATNLLTGVCCSYYDSVPTLLLTGQVPASQLRRDSESRQIGFQETDVVSIFSSVTKLSVLVDNPQRILFELDRAVWNCFTGRMGPCLIDICDDVQRALVCPADLPRFEGQSTGNNEVLNTQEIYIESATSKSDHEESVVQLLRNSRRPLLVLGAGVRSANAIELATNLIKKLQIPFALTWGLLDSFAHDDELCVGTFGVTSGKAGNFIVQNADLLIVLGSRLDTHEIGNNASLFAPNAKKIMVDIDASEIDKFQNSGMIIDEPILMDCRLFMQTILARNDLSLEGTDKAWIPYIAEMKTKYPSCSEMDQNQTTQVNPYFFMNRLSQKISNNAGVITDCGSNLIWTMQGMTTGSSRQRIISAWNHSPMGYALPAAVGAFFAGRHDQIICITGDGGLQINIQELATIQRHALPLKIFVMNNHGHGIIQGTQDQWLNGSHVASSESGGLPDPDFASIFRAYGITTIVCIDNSSVDEAIDEILKVDGPIACIVDMQAGPQIYPKLLAGKAIHESFPQVTDVELSNAMRF